MGKFRRWRVGRVEITRVQELELPTSTRFLFRDLEPAQLEPHAHWLRPHFVDAEGQLVLSIHAFLLRSQGQRIVVDTCLGNGKRRTIPMWNELDGPFLSDIADAGFPREAVDQVICTHLHVDHVGWNTMREGDAWVPTFPRARYLFARREWEHWRVADEKEFGDVIGDSVRPVLDAGIAELVETEHRLTDEVRLEPTPGHTPGHVSVRIRSEGEEAVITGDLLHHPFQCALPGIGSVADVDPARARETRMRFLGRCADERVLVLGTHFAAPTAGRVCADGHAWRFEAGAD